jgi:hypothetical protein
LPTSSPALAVSQSGYGLGWMSGEYGGLRVINHSGGTYGFGSELAFLPKADLGIVILSNARTPAGAFPYAVQFRLLELLFDQDPEIDAHYAALFETMSAASAVQLGPIDPTAVAPYLGRYAHPELGAATVSLRGDRLVLNVGELGSELRTRATDAGSDTAYLLHDPPLSLFSEAGATISFDGGATPRVTFTIPANPTGPEQTYVFEPLAPDGTPTP